jgi:hypothetical protein
VELKMRRFSTSRREKRNVYNILVENCEGENALRGLRAYRKIVLKWIVKKQGVMVAIRFTWHKMASGVEILCARQRTFGLAFSCSAKRLSFVKDFSAWSSFLVLLLANLIKGQPVT